VLAQAGKVLRLRGGTSVTAVGDPGTFECTTNPDPDGRGRDTDPYGLAARGGTFYVADAAGNDVVRITNGVTSLATVLSTDENQQQVPTSLAFGPDGALYIGTLNFEAGPGGAKVYRYDPRSGATKVYAEGLTAVTGIAFGDDGRLYVCEWATGFDQNGPSANGDVVVIPRGGGSAGRQVIGQGSIHFPGGVAVIGHHVYVSNWSIATGEDGPFGPGNHGQLLRFSTGRD
jgi:glucose/arabinose dehydrogenase